MVSASPNSEWGDTAEPGRAGGPQGLDGTDFAVPGVASGWAESTKFSTGSDSNGAGATLHLRRLVMPHTPAQHREPVGRM